MRREPRAWKRGAPPARGSGDCLRHLRRLREALEAAPAIRMQASWVDDHVQLLLTPQQTGGRIYQL